MNIATRIFRWRVLKFQILSKLLYLKKLKSLQNKIKIKIHRRNQGHKVLVRCLENGFTQRVTKARRRLRMMEVTEPSPKKISLLGTLTIVALLKVNHNNQAVLHPLLLQKKENSEKIKRLEKIVSRITYS